MDLTSDPVITGVTLSKNAINGVELDSGSLSGNESWNNPDIVYQISGNVTVPQGDTLTVAAGQIVKAPLGNNNLIVNGTLLAVGGPFEPIVFTSYRDDANGGDTNGDTSVGKRGDWGSIQFGPTSTGSLMNNVQVLFSGGWGAPAAVVDNGGQLTLDNSLESDSFTAGMRISSANPLLDSSTFQNNNGVAISIDLASNPATGTLTASGDSVNAVVADSGTLAADLAWTGQGLPYSLAGTVTIPQGVTLTIGAGTAFAGQKRHYLRRQRCHRQRGHVFGDVGQQRSRHRLASDHQHRDGASSQRHLESQRRGARQWRRGSHRLFEQRTLGVAGNLGGNTLNADQFTPSSVILNGNGTASAPQVLEAMGSDQAPRRRASARTLPFPASPWQTGPTSSLWIPYLIPRAVVRRHLTRTI